MMPGLPWDSISEDASRIVGAQLVIPECIVPHLSPEVIQLGRRIGLIDDTSAREIEQKGGSLGIDATSYAEEIDQSVPPSAESQRVWLYLILSTLRSTWSSYDVPGATASEFIELWPDPGNWETVRGSRSFAGVCFVEKFDAVLSKEKAHFGC